MSFEADILVVLTPRKCEMVESNPFIEKNNHVLEMEVAFLL